MRYAGAWLGLRAAVHAGVEAAVAGDAAEVAGVRGAGRQVGGIDLLSDRIDTKVDERSVMRISV